MLNARGPIALSRSSRRRHEFPRRRALDRGGGIGANRAAVVRGFGMWKWPGPDVRVRASTYGLIVLGCLTTAAVLFGDQDRKVGSLIFEYQTLLAGGLAIVAALISLAGPRSQVKQADDLQKEIAIREELAAKAMLPIALSYIAEYARACIVLSELHYQKTGRVGNPIALPTFDRSNLSLVRDCIKYAPSLHRDRMVALLSRIQILEASAVSKIDTFPEYNLVLVCIDVDYLCNIIVGYARGMPVHISANEPLKTPVDYIRRTLVFHSRGIDFWPSLGEFLERKEASDIKRQPS